LTQNAKENLLCLAQSILVVATVVGLVLVVAFASWASGYRTGWCESRGGTHISGGKCDINGQVIHVVERED
jgi:hypothetical protein